MVIITSLYDLIKEQVKLKGRPLKIITDWDEVIHPTGPGVLYELIKEKDWHEGRLPEFREWFKEFWAKSIVKDFSDKEKVKKWIFIDYARATKMYTENKWLEEFRKSSTPEEFKEQFWKPWFKILDDENYYNNAPLLIAAEDLWNALNEGLISQLVFVSSTRGVDNRKRNIFENVFAINHKDKCQIFLNSQNHYTKTNGKRCDWIKENHSDFDIFVDDNIEIITETKKIFGPEKLYVSPKQEYITDVYPELYKSENFFLYPNIISSEGFIQTAAKYKVKQANNQPNNESINYPLWISLGAVAAVLIGVIFYFFTGKAKNE